MVLDDCVQKHFAVSGINLSGVFIDELSVLVSILVWRRNLILNFQQLVNKSALL